jgi:glycosyltransferase involved in cell wall biosynthesis
MAATVVHVLDSTLPRAGCMHSHVAGLASILPAHGFESALFAAEAGKAVNSGNGHNPSGIHWQPCSTAEFEHGLEGAALIHVHGISALCHPALQGPGRRKAAPLVISPYGALLPNPWRRLSLLQRLRDWFAPPLRRCRSAVLLADNAEEARHLETLHPRVEILPAGVTSTPPPAGDPAWLAAQLGGARERRCALFLGPIDPLQGLVPLLKACERVVPHAPQWHLLIAGPVCGNWLKMIKPAVERRRLSDRVSFVLDPDLTGQHDLLRHSEVVVQPSLLAQPPLAAMSGLLHGKPCVVSSRCHLLDSAADWACQVPPSKDDLVRALQTVLGETAEQHGRRGATGRSWVLGHRAWDALGPDYASFYRRCLC